MILDQLCRFCNQLVTYAPLQVDIRTRIGFDLFFCSPCQTEYSYKDASNIFYKHAILESFSLYTTINDKLYRVHYQINDSRLGFQKDKMYIWYVKTPGIPGVSPNRNVKLIKSFKHDGNFLTPQNVNARLQTWLAFS